MRVRATPRASDDVNYHCPLVAVHGGIRQDSRVFPLSRYTTLCLNEAKHDMTTTEPRLVLVEETGSDRWRIELRNF